MESPKKKGRPHTQGPTHAVVASPNTSVTKRSGVRLAVWLHHRRPRLDCGCREVCYCTQPPFSKQALDGWRDAAQHILDTDRMPLVPFEVRRALWRRGGADRELAELLHGGCGGQL